MTGGGNLGGLRAALDGVGPGELRGAHANAIVAALGDVWHTIEGADQQSMGAHKLHRAESLRWDPPILSFIIERHGGTVLGSSRAELQRWQVNVAEASAHVEEVGYRQLRPNSPRWDARGAAEVVVAAIRAGADAPFLRWKEGRVRVMVGQVLPKGPKQTTEGRRARFRGALDAELRAAGWEPVLGSSVYWQRSEGSPDE